jgi:hypothetical protein
VIMSSVTVKPPARMPDGVYGLLPFLPHSFMPHGA